jgi:hypothetical protein
VAQLAERWDSATILKALDGCQFAARSHGYRIPTRAQILINSLAIERFWGAAHTQQSREEFISRYMRAIKTWAPD